jgi:hypothetical protein
MQLLDPIDSLLQLFDNPSIEEQALNNFDKELTPLMEILEEIITRHIDTVRNRNQAKTIIGCIVLRNQITWYLSNPNIQTGRGE